MPHGVKIDSDAIDLQQHKDLVKPTTGSAEMRSRGRHSG